MDSERNDAAEATRWYARTAPRSQDWQLLAEHLREVEHLAGERAALFGREAEARAAGILHDLGKYGDLFQERLRGRASGVDHWSPGAWAALTRLKSVAIGLAVQGHHVGLQRMDPDSLRSIGSFEQLSPEEQRPRPSVPTVDEALRRLQRDGLAVPYAPGYGLFSGVGGMLDVRMLFSALVDADYLSAEGHANRVTGRSERPKAPHLDASRALAAIKAAVEVLARDRQTRGLDSADVQAIRSRLFNASLEAAASSPGLFTMTAPTGSGKTLSMLAFALAHAARHGLRRIVLAVPYLTIIEQTSEAWKRILGRESFGEHFILEHHSLTGLCESAAGDREAPATSSEAALLVENWDAPLILTTTVQLFESLFAASGPQCRKLHNLAQSVILFDEAQTLPLALAIPTLKALSRLAGEPYGSTVVFATATQPAFASLDPHVRETTVQGWSPREITPSPEEAFQRLRRVRYRWPATPDMRTSFEGLAERIVRDHPQALVIVNLKQHARELTALLGLRRPGEVRHLSTSLCPAHRLRVLDEVVKTLDSGGGQVLVSTQCVEAGVDISFPVVFRSLGPADAIAQAAGRCNRHGTLSEGIVEVFIPEDERYPDASYQRAASVLRSIWARRGAPLEPDNPADLALYWAELYGLTRPEDASREITGAVGEGDFQKTARSYRLIPGDSINVLVPYDEAVFRALVAQEEAHGIGGGWMRRAGRYCVSVFRPSEDAVAWSRMRAARLRDGTPASDFYIYLKAEDYHIDGDLGLVVPDQFEVEIA